MYSGIQMGKKNDVIYLAKVVKAFISLRTSWNGK